MVQGEFYDTGRFAPSTVQQSSQIIPTAIPSTASPTPTTSSSAVYTYQQLTTNSVAESSGSSLNEEPYYYVHEGKYYYWNTQESSEVDLPQDVWVKNANGWSETNREKYWRFWDGKKTFYQ